MLEKAKCVRGYDIEDMTETQIAMVRMHNYNVRKLNELIDAYNESSKMLSEFKEKIATNLEDL